VSKAPSSAAATADPLFAMARAVLFRLDPERAHDAVLSLLDRPLLQRWVGRHYVADAPSEPCRLMGIDFPNPIGLAAGLDKNGDHIDALGALGFGSLEIGTVTPRPQPGNTTPRLFRLTSHDALINRMGFNNLGIDHLVSQVEKRRWQGPLGINIGKNASTPLEQAADDYVFGLERAYPVADWITVNISSPNTANLRDLQHGQALQQLLERLADARVALASRHGRQVPLAVKMAPDMPADSLDGFCESLVTHGIDALICGNTTNERAAVAGHRHAEESGGLSGAPLRELANTQLANVAQRLRGTGIVLIGAGGITSGDDAAEKRALGADLVQLYTGLIYRGPALVRDAINKTSGLTSPKPTNPDPTIPS